MKTKNWFCIKYLIHDAWIGEDWRKFENWEDADKKQYKISNKTYADMLTKEQREQSTQYYNQK